MKIQNAKFGPDNLPRRERERPACPQCGKNDAVIPIQYGYPAGPLRNDVYYGGCVVPQKEHWYCKRDSLKF